MRSIKRALDPDDRMNPGKVLDMSRGRLRADPLATIRDPRRIDFHANTRTARRRRVLMVGADAFAAQQAGTGRRTPASSAPAQPQIQLAPGLREVPDYRKVDAEPPAPTIPDGFTSLFNGKDLTGWHVSKTARHGVQPDFHVAHGMILGTQRPLGSGGLLLTDRQYRNFELYMEVKPDWGNDSGIFFRTTETGVAYQITLDYLPGGSMGRLISEGGIQFGAGRGGAPATPAGGTGGGRAQSTIPA